MPAELMQDVYLYLERDVQTTQVHPVAGGVAAVFTTRCPGKQTANEDAAAVVPFDDRRGILAVADGFGGQPAGEKAAAAAIHSVADAVGHTDAVGAELRDGILNGFECANQAVLGLGVGAATTLAVIELNNRTIRPYHVGDSGILVVGQRGAIRLQTVSHSPVGYGVEAGLLKAGEAMNHRDRHLVSNLVGSIEMRIDVGPVMALRPKDTVFVASDGVFDNLHLDEIVDKVRKGPLEKACRSVADRCLGRMTSPRNGSPSKPDDLTMILFRLVST